MNHKGAGMCLQHFYHYIDHTLPLCELFNAPLLMDDFSLYFQTKILYPFKDINYIEPKGYSLHEILSPYSFLIYTELYRKHHGSFEFGELLFEGPARSVCAPHGNSDKGAHAFWMERYVDEDIVLIYGDKMERFFVEKGVHLERAVRCGNYRYAYYLKNRDFFDRKAEEELKKRRSTQCTLFYAPTWQMNNPTMQDPLDKSSLFDASSWIFDVPEEFCLIVKLHPNLYRFYPEEVLEIKKTVGFQPNVIFLEEGPLIYPYLAASDAYVGDFSSVGYDFLSFDRPLYFLNFNRRPLDDPGLSLYRAGRHFMPEEFPQFYQKIAAHFANDQTALSSVRQELYRDVFDDSALPFLKGAVENLLNQPEALL